jgi:hypothetical protein
MSINNSKNQGEYRKAINDLESNYLPKSGGTMTGAITTKSAAPLSRDVNSSSLEIHGGTQYTTGAYLYLTGQDSSYAGQFTLAASGNGTIYRLVGKTDGALTWNSSSVITATTKDAITNKNTLSDYKVPTQVLKATLTSTASDGTSGTTTNNILSVGRQDGNGLNTILGSNGGTIIVSGEGSSNVNSDLSLVGVAENITLAADAAVVMRVNCQNGYASGTSLTFTKDSAFVTSKGSSGTQWYRKWNDGFIEQGGTVSLTNGSWGIPTVTLLTAFSNTNYTISVSGISYTGSYHAIGCLQGKTTTSFKHYFYMNNSIAPTWYACGY